MSLIVAFLSILLTGSMGMVVVRATEVAVLRARAQAAADASALAAVAESSPSGRNLQTALARRFARLNGADLLACVCDAGSTAVQVRVEVDGVEAVARAVVDPSAFAPLAGVQGLQPEMQAAVDHLLRVGGGRITLVSGYRSSERQAELWNQALIRYGSAEAADDWVAPPGHSMHEKGLAADLGGDLELAVRLVAEHAIPLYRPLDHEPWHFELLGSRD